MPDSDPKTYLNQAGFAARAGLAVQSMTHRLDTGALPAPDVIVGSVLLDGSEVLGWSAERVTAYIDYGELLRKLHPEAKRKLPFDLHPQPSWWPARTEWFLSRAEVAHVLGVEPITISMRMIRGTFPVTPRVIIGQEFHGRNRGWDLDEVVEFGKQAKYLDGAGKVADVGRLGPPRKVHDPQYWKDQVATRRTARQRRETVKLPQAA